jgi:5-formyltetrahydrofolate cyclo-ligase
MKKEDARKLILKKRMNFSETERLDLSRQIIDKVKANFDLKNKNLSVFLPIERFVEIETSPLLEIEDARIGLPIVQPEGEMKHILFESQEQIEISDWGIPEPTHGQEVEADFFDFVFVPLLAFDKNGYRVGYGKGFYDRFLAKCKTDCVFIGLSFFESIESIEDLNEFDAPLNYCISPQRVYKF